MIEIKRTFKFDAAHFIPNHPGKCINLHGHTWKVTVGINYDYNPHNGPPGMLFDFGDIKEIVEPVLNKYDHHYLNEIIPNPTAEALAYTLYHELKGALKDPSGKYWLCEISVKESDDTEVIYRW